MRIYTEPLDNVRDIVTTVDGSRAYPSLDGVYRIQQGQTAVFTSTTPTTFASNWLKNGEVIRPSSKPIVQQLAVPGRQTSQLTINNAMQEDSGVYTAVFKNDAEVLSRSAITEVVGECDGMFQRRLSVYLIYCCDVCIWSDANAPVIQRRPDIEPEVTEDSVTARLGRPTVVARKGQNVIVQADVSGSGVLTRWYKGDGTQIQSRGALEITEFGEDDVGDYVMVAENGQGIDRERMALQLASKPKISSPGPVRPDRPLIDEDKEYNVGEPADIVEGRTVTVKASFSGEPRGEIRWMLPSGTTLRPGEMSDRVGVLDNGDLQVVDAEPGDSGEYMSIIRNEAGEENITTTIKVYRKVQTLRSQEEI